MRNPNKPNLANIQPSLDHSAVRRSLFAAVPVVVLMIVVCGCSKMAVQQQASFKPLSQPKSLAEREQQSVDQILQRQEEVRLAAKKAEEEANLAATEMADDLSDQQDDIVSEAAARAESIETAMTTAESEFAIAQVSFESELEPAADEDGESGSETPQSVDADSDIGAEIAQNADEPDTTTTDSAFSEFKSIENNIRLMANVDDLEGVPNNMAREELDFSTANLLRPSKTGSSDFDEVEVEAPPAPIPSQEVTDITPPPFSSGSESLRLPLQPMLFNPETRTKKTIVEGTLRPLRTNNQEMEPDVAVEKASTEVADVPTFQPLSPLQNLQPPTIKLETTREADVPATESVMSRLLQPIERNVVEIADAIEATEPVFTPPNTPSVAPASFEVAAKVEETETTEAVEPMPEAVEPMPETADFESPPTPIFVSEQIIVVDPPAQSTEPKPVVSVPEPIAPRFAITPEPLEISEFVPKKAAAQPIVDESLSQASASYLLPRSTSIEVTEEAFIPAEVFEDAATVAEDLEREMMAEAIPVGPIETPNNDFKVRAASSTTTVSEPCANCDSDNCTGCEPERVETHPVHTDRGEPLFQNNDFGTPESPGGDFVAPMTITPTEVPVAIPEPMPTASTDFGNPVDLQAPEETDEIVAHVAALPTNGFVSRTGTSKVPPVGVSTLMDLNAITWKSRLDQAIELADERLNRMNQPTDSGMVNLRLLKALRGQMEQMETSSGQLSENESQYWQHQLEAITSMLGTPTGDNKVITDYHRHQTAHKTLEHLRNAVSQLESIASLKVTSGQFCTEITGFGQFRTFPNNVFTSGQKMLVYCEVENYRTIEQQSVTGNDFRTRLRGSFAIYDSEGKVVQQAEYPAVDDVARKRRRDFYMYMPVTLAELPAGNYVLHALVEDVHGTKTASLDPPLQFSIK